MKAKIWLRYMTGLVTAMLTLHAGAEMASFDSGSDGSDGDLSVPAQSGTIVFDPMDESTFGRVLDQDGDGVFHFTTISVGAGSTLKFRGDVYNRPVYWLASGAVKIDGVLDLKGENGLAFSDPNIRRVLRVPGSGGYAGGAGGSFLEPKSASTNGDGPGGGAAGHGSCNESVPTGGQFTGNRFLVPLLGGSGGGGGAHTSARVSYHGSAGGGAIMIASSTSISVNGFILAPGGNHSGLAGNGSGGAIRLVAPLVNGGCGSGKLSVIGGKNSSCAQSHGGDGKIRLEGFSVFPSCGTNIYTPPAPVSIGRPVDSFIPQSAVRIDSIDGVPVSLTPAGSFLFPPDVTINNSEPVPVVVSAKGIPPNTDITVKVFADNPNDPLTLSRNYIGTLAGTQEASTATVNIPFPFGLTRTYIRVSWEETPAL